MNSDGARQAHSPAPTFDRVPVETVIFPANRVDASSRDTLDARLEPRVLPMAVRDRYLMLQRLYRLRQRRHVARIDRANASEGQHTVVASDSRMRAQRPDDRRPSVAEV